MGNFVQMLNAELNSTCLICMWNIMLSSRTICNIIQQWPKNRPVHFWFLHAVKSERGKKTYLKIQNRLIYALVKVEWDNWAPFGIELLKFLALCENTRHTHTHTQHTRHTNWAQSIISQRLRQITVHITNYRHDLLPLRPFALSLSLLSLDENTN